MTTTTTNSKRLIVIVGATGSGKTDLSIRLARHYHAPILSTDSRQLYRGMPIGTAQPTEEQLREAEHHFIACLNVEQEFNCGQFEQQALELLKRLFADHDTVVAVGGSGLYIRALCEGMDDLPTGDPEIRRSLSEKLQREGLATLCEELKQRDPLYYEQVDRSNPARVLRALEVCRQTGRPYSEQRTGERRSRDFRIIKIGTEMERATLYERINRRVDQMIDEGLEQEARALYPKKELNALQTVGYKELFGYFDGAWSREEAIELIKRNTRRYAKRQLTWFRRDPEIFWAAPDKTDKIIAYIDSCL